MPYAIRKRKIFRKKIKFYVLRPVRGVWKIVKTHYNPKNENLCNGVFDSSNEAFGCTGYNAKTTPTLKPVPLLKISGKTTKTVIFEKIVFLGGFLDFFQQRYIAKSWGFLRCNQCIPTLHLSYQTPPYNDFHFSGSNGFLQFFRRPVPGVKRKILFFFKIFSVFLWHKAYKTIQKRTSVKIVPPLT